WHLRFGLMPPHPGAFIRKTVYEKVGRYKLGYKIGADFDMFVRMLLVHKLPYKKLNRTLVRMRMGGVSTSGFESYLTSTKEMLRSLSENHIYSNLIMVLIRLPVKYLQKILPNLVNK
ncbi:MAG: glycosyltransferase, partial [Methylophagaceae bacterium]